MSISTNINSNPYTSYAALTAPLLASAISSGTSRSVKIHLGGAMSEGFALSQFVVEGMRRLAPAHIAPEAQEYARRENLTGDLRTCLDAVRRHFVVAGPLEVSFEDDGKASRLVIDAPVRGTPEEASASHWKYTQETMKALGHKREWINLICDVQ